MTEHSRNECVKDYTGTETELFRNALSKPDFDPVRDTDEFRQIEAVVNAYLASAKS